MAIQTIFVKKGQRFGMLEVIDIVSTQVIAVRCDCGTIKTTKKYNLVRRQGSTKSCGCLQKELLIKRNRKTKGILEKPYGYSAITIIMKNYRCGAKSRGLEFSLTRDDFVGIVNKECHYCGEKDTLTLDTKAYQYSYNGIDRVDNTKGYLTNNVVPCCIFCNRAKYTHSKGSFIEFCKKVAEHNKK